MENSKMIHKRVTFAAALSGLLFFAVVLAFAWTRVPPI